MSNLDLWNAVCETDPKHTKGFNKKGFRGTTANTTYLIRKATERWGPMGIKWGLRIDDEQYVAGGHLDEHGTRETIHVLRAALWFHEGDGKGEVTHYGQTTFVGKDSRGIVTDEEAPKKSLTDALAKCLSMLGFSADIFLGLYDDNKYVAEMRKKYSPNQQGNEDRQRQKPSPKQTGRSQHATQPPATQPPAPPKPPPKEPCTIDEVVELMVTDDGKTLAAELGKCDKSEQVANIMKGVAVGKLEDDNQSDYKILRAHGKEMYTWLKHNESQGA